MVVVELSDYDLRDMSKDELWRLRTSPYLLYTKLFGLRIERDIEAPRSLIIGPHASIALLQQDVFRALPRTGVRDG